MSIFSRLFRKKSPEDAAQASAKGGKESPSVEESQAHQTTGGEYNTKENMNNDVATKPKGCGQEEAKSTSADEKISVYHLIVLDESGSMSCVWQQTISGCNETIQTIRQMQKDNPDQQHFVSIYLFCTGNNRYIAKNVKVEKVKEITHWDYKPNSCTPLFDALGYTLTELKAIIKPKKSLGYVTIITDGYENDSHEYTIEKVRQLIDELKKMDVIFTFVGANIDAADYASRLNINNSMQFKQTQEGMHEMWEQEKQSRRRSSAQMRFFSKFMTDEMNDFGARGNSGHYYDNDIDESRITPGNITSLGKDEVFVFGSNKDGQHNGGASAMAAAKFGAVMGQAEGLQGQSYAITTDGVTEEEMYKSIDRFCDFAKDHPELTFLVTAVGCGSAGYTPYVVAPMFRKAVNLTNVKLPKAFWIYTDRAYV